MKNCDSIDEINLETLHLKKYPNTRILIENLFDSTLEVIPCYYICNGCGHMYWYICFLLHLFNYLNLNSSSFSNFCCFLFKREGPHWQNILTRFSHVLTPQSFDDNNKNRENDEINDEYGKGDEDNDNESDKNDDDEIEDDIEFKE